ncbi:DUF2613 domain-containing protein [Nocardia cyriacigeorgica]|uniref:DUF2613 domain-containing protein n=1 Tax=Nocardia cyriacigeorgica TaxID=135487 RepID=A0ABX0CGX6_9NOCA|nr:DUF2613 domain-containing protein [Nocardia cyriacigeorgica]NEW55126.1 DUF2613 domain-containing protein [Nocardia cyriacigeorgica]
MKFAVSGMASGLAGATLGVIAVLGITAGVQQNSIPEPETVADPGSSQLGDVAYGSR